VTGQHLSECGSADAPPTGLRHLVLEVAADAELSDGALPARATGAALVAEAAQVFTIVAEQVAVARDVKTGRPVADVVLLVQGGFVERDEAG